MKISQIYNSYHTPLNLQEQYSKALEKEISQNTNLYLNSITDQQLNALFVELRNTEV